MFRSIVRHYQNKVKQLEIQVQQLEGEIRDLEWRENVRNETIAWYQEIRFDLASTGRINVDLLSGAIQWQDKNTGEWKSHTDA